MKTLADYPELCTQLHPDNETGLNPEAISYGSNKKLLWKCSVSDDHVWKASVKERLSNGRGCPFCAGKKASVTNRLDIRFPDLATMWLQELNGGLDVSSVTYGSGKIFWWQCPKGEQHKFQARVTELVNKKAGCPFCRGKKICDNNNLAKLFPTLASQWHQEKNAGLSP